MPSAKIIFVPVNEFIVNPQKWIRATRYRSTRMTARITSKVTYMLTVMKKTTQKTAKRDDTIPVIYSSR